jgi:hypothetical protein
MATTAPQTETAETETVSIGVGATVTFKGYTSLPEGEEPILVIGETYTVARLGADGALVIEVPGGRGDTVFPEELELVTNVPAATTATTADVTDTRPKPKRQTKAKAETPAVAAKAEKPKRQTKKGKVKEALEASKTHLGTGTPAADPTAGITTIKPTESNDIVAITDSPTVQKLLAGQDALRAAKVLALQAEETFYSLGGVLSHVYSEGLFKTIQNEDGTLKYDGKRGFAEYMLGELNIQYRKGMYLIDIYAVCRKLDISEQRVAEIGWSKMKEISNKLDAVNAEELLDYARDHNREELVAHVRTTYVSGEEAAEPRVAKTRLTFSLFADQTETVQRAMEAAKTQVGGDATPEQALVLITAEWSQLTESVEISLEEALRSLNARFGTNFGESPVAETDADESDDDTFATEQEVGGELVEA